MLLAEFHIINSKEKNYMPTLSFYVTELVVVTNRRKN
jgi:hypothetical protein